MQKGSQSTRKYYVIEDDPVDELRLQKQTWLESLARDQVVEIALRLDDMVDPVRGNRCWPAHLRKEVPEPPVAIKKEETQDEVPPADATTTAQNGIGGHDRQVSDQQPPPLDEFSQALTLVEPNQPSGQQQETGQPPDADHTVLPPPPGVPPYPYYPYPPPHGVPPHPGPPYPYPPYPGYFPYPFPYLPQAGPSSQHQPSPFTSQPLARPNSTSASTNPSNSVKTGAPSRKKANASDDIDEDLPSYEEMIVNALHAGNEVDGMAPRDLFAWMQTHYPLQTNFRPSASQALQKAFKRGRLEKSNAGKYRVNAAWEGGSTSKRATRRPRFVTPPPHGQSNAYPYRWASYAPNGAGTPAEYQQGQHEHDHQQQPQDLNGSQEAFGGMSSAHAIIDWEAAQTILQALDIGSLLAANAAAQKGFEEVGEGADADDVDTNADGGDDYMIDPALRDTQRNVNHDAQPSVTTSQPAPHRPPIFAAHDSFPTAGPSSTSLLDVLSGAGEVPGFGLPAHRTGLQKSLAMLAAQLADMAGLPLNAHDSVDANADESGPSNGRGAVSTVTGWISYERPV